MSGTSPVATSPGWRSLVREPAHRTSDHSPTGRPSDRRRPGRRTGGVLLAIVSANLWCMTTVPLSEAKDKLSALVEAAETTHDIVTITRHGREAAVLMAKADLDSLHETIFWLSQPGVREDVEQARRELAEGRTVAASDLRREYGLSE